MPQFPEIVAPQRRDEGKKDHMLVREVVPQVSSGFYDGAQGLHQPGQIT
jgi:hypothetical protein